MDALESFVGLMMGLLQTVLVTVIPILTTFIIRFLMKWTQQKLRNVENDKAKQYFAELTGVIEAAVAHTSQTYVDSIKASDKFDAEAQHIAVEKAKTTAVNILTDDAKKFFEKSHKDLRTLLEAKIEQTVRAQKTPAMTVVPAVPVANAEAFATNPALMWPTP